MSSNQIQLANVYDINGNSLLLNEIVLNDRKYIFERISSSIHLNMLEVVLVPFDACLVHSEAKSTFAANKA